MHRRHHPRRIPQVHRKGRRAGTPLPAGAGRRADGQHTIAILKGLRDRYEAHHRASITDSAIVAAATLADRYINDRFLPDKAIDLIDEAGARTQSAMTAPPDLREFDEKIAEARREKESAIDVAGLRKGRQPARPRKAAGGPACRARKAMALRRYGRGHEVDDNEIAEVLGNWTGIRWSSSPRPRPPGCCAWRTRSTSGSSVRPTP